LHYGAQTGVVVSDQDYTYRDTEFTFNPRSSIGGTLGVYADLAWSRTLSTRLQVLYVRKGSEAKVLYTEIGVPLESGAAPKPLKDAIDYLSIVPLLKAGVSFGPGRPYVMVGPRLDLKVGGDSELNSVASDGLETLNWGVTGAVGYELPVGESHRLTLEIHYHRDFSDAYRLTRLTVRNRALIVMVGMTI
jgi:hypothetical protein